MGDVQVHILLKPNKHVLSYISWCVGGMYIPMLVYTGRCYFCYEKRLPDVAEAPPGGLPKVWYSTVPVFLQHAHA